MDAERLSQRRAAPRVTLVTWASLSLLTSACDSEVVYRDVPLPLDLSPCVSQLSPRLKAGGGAGGAGGAPWSAEGEQGCVRQAGDTPQGCLLIESPESPSLALPIYLDGDGLHLLGAEQALVDLRVPAEGAAPAEGAFVILAEGLAASPAACADLAVPGECDSALGCALKVRFWLHRGPEGAVRLTPSPDEEGALCRWVPSSRAEEELCDDLDNDCDGLIDEGLGLEGRALGVFCRLTRFSCELEGVVACGADGKRECVSDAALPPESCDGEDNDCDGAVDEAFADLPERCDGVDEDCDGRVDEGALDEQRRAVGETCRFGVGACEQAGAVRCVGEGDLDAYALPAARLGAALCLPLGPVEAPADDEIDGSCDAVDDDCDGFADEGFTRSVVDCGEGACAARGQLTCVDNTPMDTCMTGAPAPADETCDGVDDDCSSQADEDFLPTPAVCGVGECVRSGTRYCFNNAERLVCAPALPSPTERDAACNNRDEDCDGLVDEGFAVTPTACGVGACAAAGERRCEEGGRELDTCAPGAPAGADDDCDGQDDDCDGREDEGFTPRALTCGAGACRAAGQTACDRSSSPPQERDLCAPAAPATALDPCDGLDNDCDGRTDEGHVDAPTSCGLGACTRAGQLRCLDGRLADSCLAPSPPDAEGDASCNRVDNDCDGLVDEGYVTSMTTCGANACAATGFLLCANGQELNTCRQGARAPSDPTCNGVDDDCDGRLDEDYAQSPTSCGVGLCAAAGARVCSGGVVVDTCAPQAPQAGDASCDGLDQDCDGAADEAYVPTPLTCGVGECRASGVRSCVAGQVVSACAPGAPTADASCDSRDNDCDGRTDEAYPAAPITCGVGACAASGQRVCLGGGVQDVCTPLAPAPSDPTCDGVDADCDGRVDENYTGTPVTCGVGACTATTLTACVGGAVTDSCAPNPAAAAPDTDCDLVDDDCDRRVDEAYAPTSVACPAGSCSAAGQSVCTTSGLSSTCVPTPATSDPTCNGVDDDCDGRLDENYVAQVSGVQISCGLGVCLNTQGTLACRNGSVLPACDPLPVSSPDTSCDGVDQDCDGRLDEAFTGVSSCGVGACARTGTRTCVNASLQDVCTADAPIAERCGDGVDNDCDGRLDEGFEAIGAPCSAGVGECARAGVWQCNVPSGSLLCSAQQGNPSPEVCNGRDEDCNGVNDNDPTDAGDFCSNNTPNSTTLAAGVCVGRRVCQGGSLVCVGSDPALRPPTGALVYMTYPAPPFTVGLVSNATCSNCAIISKIKYDVDPCENDGTRWICRNNPSYSVTRPWCTKTSNSVIKNPKCDKDSTICCNSAGQCEPDN